MTPEALTALQASIDLRHLRRNHIPTALSVGVVL